jgi:hypothetical protein
MSPSQKKCLKAGHEVQVFLDGKDEQGRTKYLNEDDTKHSHFGSDNPQQQQQLRSQLPQEQLKDLSSLQSALKVNFDVINAKLDRIIALLEKEQYKPWIKIQNTGLKI